MNPNQADLFKQGVAESRNGNIQKAREIFQKILDEEPNNILVLLWGVKSAQYQEEAFLLLDRLNNLAPANPDIEKAMEWAIKLPKLKKLEEINKCSFCGETIKSDAVVCRYCGSNFQILNRNIDVNTPKTINKSGNLITFVIIVIVLVGSAIGIILYSDNQKNAPVNNPVISLQSSSSEYVVGTWLDTWALTRTIVITKENSTYRMTTKYSDGSGSTITLGTNVVNGEERLIEMPDSRYGDYMVIEIDGSLAFYDNQGLIYILPPK